MNDKRYTVIWVRISIQKTASLICVSAAEVSVQLCPTRHFSIFITWFPPRRFCAKWAINGNGLPNFFRTWKLRKAGTIVQRLAILKFSESYQSKRTHTQIRGYWYSNNHHHELLRLLCRYSVPTITSLLKRLIQRKLSDFKKF